MALIFILFLILFNGLFSMSEIAIITSRKSKLAQLAAAGNHGASVALKLAQMPDKFFSTIQVGITLIAILAGALGEATIKGNLSSFIVKLPFLNLFADPIAFLVTVIFITYLSVVLGELVPKRFAISNPEGIACVVAPVMNSFLKISYPVVKILSNSTESIFRLLGIKKISSPTVSDEEVRMLMGEGTRIGVFSTIEKKLVDRVLHLDDMRIVSLMTPRASIKYFDADNLTSDLKKRLQRYKYSRIIVCEQTLDNLRGIIHVKDLLRLYLNNPKIEIKNHLEKPHLLPEDTHVLKALELFRKSPIHMAFIIDEHGTVVGLVTFNDVLEAIVGDMQTRGWVEKLQIIKRSDNSYLIDGMITTRELAEELKIKPFPVQGTNHLTLGGFIMARLQKVPSEGDSFVWDKHEFEVVDMDKNRVDKVLVTDLSKNKSKTHQKA